MEEKKNLKQLNARYAQRITLVKLGKEAYNNQNFMQAIKQYNGYLKILAEVKEVSENLLNPDLFDKEKDMSELMLISHLFFDLARIYDNAPNLEMEFQRCLQKFIDFTVNSKYQVFNGEMLRKYLRRKQVRHKKDFDAAYKKIFISSKKCFIATYCYGEEHPITVNLRLFKNKLIQFPFGVSLVRLYYLYSSSWVEKCQQNPPSKALLWGTRQFLAIFSKLFSFFSSL